MELEIAIARKSKLQDKYEQIDRKLERDLRYLKWKQKKSCPKNVELSGKNYDTTCIREQPSYFRSCTKFKIMEHINSSPEIQKHHVSPNNKEDKKIDSSLFNTFNILETNFKNNIDGKFSPQYLKQIVELCHEKMFEPFYDKSFYDEMKTIREDSKTEKQFTKKIQNIKKLRSKNSILSEQDIVVHDVEEDDTDFFDDVKQLQKIFRGRAYQTMIMMAEIRLKPFLESVECTALQTPAHSSTIVTINDELHYGELEFSTERYISRFFDTLSKESILVNEESKNAMTVELAEVTRTMREACEGKRRQLEQAGRKEQDEILKQVLRIHQDLSEIFFDEFMEKAIEQCAEEEGLKLMREITSKKTYNGYQFYNMDCKNIENELVYNTIIPEAYKIIHRENTY